MLQVKNQEFSQKILKNTSIAKALKYFFQALKKPACYEYKYVKEKKEKLTHKRKTKLF